MSLIRNTKQKKKQLTLKVTFFANKEQML